MNATAVIRSAPVTEKMIVSARELAHWYEKEQARPGTALTIYTLVHEIELLREAAKGAVIVVNQAVTDKNLAALRASALLNVAEKIAPVLDQEIEQRQAGGNPEDWALLQVLSDELHATMKLVRG
jgi:hypothetical protein